MLKKTTILCTILLAACRSGTPTPVSTTLPATPAPPAKWTTPSAGSQAEPVAWLSQFNGGGMADAVREAVGASFDLQASAARMSQARARALRSGADLFPEVTTGLSSGQDWEKSTGLWSRTEDYTLTLNASWEADLWGRMRDSRDASRMEAEAAAADYAAARLSTAAAAARAWCNLIEANLQAALVEETVASFRRNLATVDSNFDRGIVCSFSRHANLSVGFRRVGSLGFAGFFKSFLC